MADNPFAQFAVGATPAPAATPAAPAAAKENPFAQFAKPSPPGKPAEGGTMTVPESGGAVTAADKPYQPGGDVMPYRAMSPMPASQMKGGAGEALGHAADFAGPGVGEMIGKGAAKLLAPAKTAAQRALEVVGRRFEQDAKGGGMSAVDALDSVRGARDSGKPAVLADYGGKNVKGLAGTVSRQPGEAGEEIQQFIKTRDEGAGIRLKDDVQKYLKSGPMMYETSQALFKARSQAAAPLYEKVQDLQGIWSPRLQTLIENPSVKQGLAHGYALERDAADAAGRPFDPTQMGVDLDAQGNPVLLRTPNMRVLDMAKRGLDDMILKSKNEVTGRPTTDTVRYEQLRRAYLDEIEKLDTSGTYKAAREAWSGPSASLDAMRFGRGDVFAKDVSPEQVTAEFSKMSDSDKEFARLGAADLLRQRIMDTRLSADESKQILNSEWTKEKLRPLFETPEKFHAFMKSINTESTMFQTGTKVLGGSQTAERLAEDSSAMQTGAELGQAAISAYNGSPGGLLSAGSRIAATYRKMRDLGYKNNPELNSAIAKLLFNPEIDSVAATATEMPAGRADAAAALGGASIPLIMQGGQQSPAGTALQGR